MTLTLSAIVRHIEDAFNEGNFREFHRWWDQLIIASEAYLEYADEDEYASEQADKALAYIDRLEAEGLALDF